MKLGTDTNSLLNHIITDAKQVEPTVGMAATICCWTDRYPGTVIEISPSGKTLLVQVDTWERVDHQGMSENQEYTYTRNRQGALYTFQLRRGQWKRLGGGEGLCLGTRERYFDFSF